MGHKLIELHEGVGVQQVADAFAGGLTSGGVQLIDPFLASAQFGKAVAFFQLMVFFLCCGHRYGYFFVIQ
jgi:hypothetical protein